MSSADSPGPSISSSEPLLIFDLDGTILSINSFPHWAKLMLSGKLPISWLRRNRLRMHAIWILVQRKALRHSHAITKQRLQQSWARLVPPDDDVLEEFTRFLLSHTRPSLQPLLDKHAGKAILATSAAEEYAQAIGKALGFRHILATERHGQENNREQKRDRVLALIAEKGWKDRPRIFFTDHEEDLPLIEACQTTLWFGKNTDIPTSDARIIPCLMQTERGIAALIN